MRRPLADADGVAVGCRTGEAADADIASGAGDVLDDDGLAEEERIGSERMRASASDGPPAGNGAIKVMGRVG